MADASRKNNEQTLSNPSRYGEASRAPHPELNPSSSVAAIPPIILGAQEPLEDPLVENADGDRAYCCKYCPKKFSNKQALGGHQNAHKIERALAKNARELQENQYMYFGGPSYHVVPSSPPFPSSFNIRSPEFINRAIMMPYQSQEPAQHGMQIGHYARPMTGMPYVPGFNHVYPGWNAPISSMYPVMAPPSHMQYNVQNPVSPPIGIGSSGAQPVFDAHPTFIGPRPISGGDLGGQNNNPMNNPENLVEEDPDLDLSLRL